MGAAVLGLATIGLVGLGLRDGDDAPEAAPTPSATATPTTPATPDPPATDPPSEPPADSPNALDDLGGLMPDAATLACLAGDAQPSLQGTPLPEDTGEIIQTIADQVAELRGFDGVDTALDLQLLGSDELAARVEAVTDEDYPEDEAALDDAILTTLGQLDPDQDLRDVYTSLLAEQVAGFYDPDTGELVAEADADPSPDQLLIISHEVDHALGDRALGLPELDGDDVDAILGRQGLVEGDASVLMQQWAIAHLGLANMFEMGTTPLETEALDAAPYVLQAQLTYPYVDGLEFVCHLWNRGGWAAVDAAYADPPTTSAEVLFPDRYGAGGAVDVTSPSAGGPWEVRRDTTWGAAELLWMLEAPGDDPARGPADARDRAADWAGGRQVTWQADGATMVALRAVQQPGGQLCASLGDWASTSWPDATTRAGDATTTWTTPDRVVDVRCDGDTVTVVIGPDEQAVAAVD